MNIINNLFYYASSELSQDAFLCYLFSFAMSENKNADSVLCSCAVDLLKLMGINDEEVAVTAIHKQYKNIDVLVGVNNKYNVIIEDKTFTSQHGNQIDEYRKTLEDEGRENIICVYYKIVEQPKPETNAINITRTDILNILEKYQTADKIFNDYVYYLKWIDNDVNSYKTAPIADWRTEYNHVYPGFFTHLVQNDMIDKNRFCGWGYVPNSSGGFWGLWWYYIKSDAMENSGLNIEYIDQLYLQIEDNKITVKMTEPKNATDQTDKVTTNIRWKLYEYFCEKVEGFQKKTFRLGKFMTVGYIEYNEQNYKEKIQIMQNAMSEIEQGGFKYTKSI